MTRPHPRSTRTDTLVPAATRCLASERGQGPLLGFTGHIDYRPNVEYGESFARRSFPQIRNRHANARFAIVGRNPAPAVRALAALPGVVVTGAVPDVRGRSEEHTSELQSLMRTSNAVFCLKKKTKPK